MTDDLNIYLEMPENFGCSGGSDSVHCIMAAQWLLDYGTRS